MRKRRLSPRAALVAIAVSCGGSIVAAADPPAIRGTFGISSSGESFGDHPRLFPLLREAGATMVRSFPEWSGIEPSRGTWNWKASDALLESARKNKIEILGMFCYLAPWASSGGTRRFPIKDIRYFEEYVEAAVARYERDITCWEVYNEFNGSFAENGTVEDYVQMVKAADRAADRVNPKAKIGIGCADVDISFLEQVIVRGGGGHFDFVNVHPYSLMGAAMEGREPVFLRMGANLRAMLRKTGQRPEIELWASEIGVPSTTDPQRERRQAEAIVKANTLCMGQGIAKVFWFEGRGRDYGEGGDFGIIRRDWSKRPSFAALQTMTRLLGEAPARLGWIDPTGTSYGFVFQGANAPVLITWATSDRGSRQRFPAAVTVTDLSGKETRLEAGKDLALTRTPVFVTGLPETIVAEARSNRTKPFPWLKDFSGAESVSCRMGASNVEAGLVQNEGGDGKTEVGLVDGTHVRRTLKDKGSEYMYFDVDDSYASVGDSAIEITVTARAVDPARGASLNLTYESAKGYRETDDTWKVPVRPGWHAHTFTLRDANFGNNWGWNFRIRMCGSPGDIWVKEVVVKRKGAKK
ncbi:MAG: glycosyl hydrolase [Planctomycetes bacterium]|nr:glycosyl hydrolase [Planctomycetota bacterium]